MLDGCFKAHVSLHKLAFFMKNIVLALFIIFFSNALFANHISNTDSLHYLNSTFAPSVLNAKSKTRIYDLLVEEAKKYIGIPYKFGGCTKSGFDCSGYLIYVYSKFDIQLPRTSIEQSKFGKRVGKRRLRKGDLIFFRGSNARKRKIGHVGIVVSNKKEPIQFIHASTSRGIIISSLSTEYYKVRYRKARRIKALNKKVK